MAKEPDEKLRRARITQTTFCLLHLEEIPHFPFRGNYLPMSFGSSASSQEAVQVIFIVASQIRTSQNRLLRFAMLEIKLPDKLLSACDCCLLSL
jgi:hypothetical protein